MKITKNIRLLIPVILSILVLSLFGLSFFSFSRGYFNHFFSKIVNPDIVQDAEITQVEVNEKNEEDVFDEDISPEVLSEKFIKYSFAKDEENIEKLLSDKTFYIKSPDGSSFIRRTGGEQHVEGYMATDKVLSKFRQKWFYSEGNEAIIGMEIIVEGEEKPYIWYMYFKKTTDGWRLYMLENE